MNIEQIVDVIISLGARPITTSGFETPLFISTHKNFDSRYRIYSSLQGVLDDGFDSDSEVGKAVSVLFQGDFRPKQVVVGRRDYDNVTLTVADTVQTGDAVGITLAGEDDSSTGKKDISVTSTGTASDDATALAAAITADVEINKYVTAAAVDAVVTLTVVAGARLTFVGDNTATVAIGYTNHEDMDDCIQAIVADNADFFFITSDSRDETDIKDLASYAESSKRIYGVAVYQAAMLDPADKTDILSELNALQYDNTFVVGLNADQAGEYHEMAVLGSMASLNAGSSTIHGKTLKGVSISDFKGETEENAVLGKKGIIYVMIAGVGFAVQGYMVSGQYFDNIRGKLWLEARLQEDLFILIKQKSDLGLKIPYTNTGVAMAVSVIDKRLQQAISQGFLSDDPVDAPVITPPLVQNIPDQDKLDRYLPDIPFTATLAGAIHTITVRGYVTI